MIKVWHCRDTKTIFHLIQPDKPDYNGICKLKITKYDKSTQLQYFFRIAMHFFLSICIFLESQTTSPAIALEKRSCLILMNAPLIPTSSLIMKEKNVSNHCWDKSAGIKSHVNCGKKIILSFFQLFHTFISALLVLEKERECYTIEYLVQLSNFFQLKCTFSKPL